MTGVVVAVSVVLTIAAAITWLGTVIAERRRETSSLAGPVSRQALDRLGEDRSPTHGTRW